MKYVFDTNVFRQIYASYYRDIFPSLWDNLEPLLRNGTISSTSVVLSELTYQGLAQDGLSWLRSRPGLFPPTTRDEGNFLRRIYAVEHFRQQNIGVRELYKGGNHADPYIVARAELLDAAVVTQETYKVHSAKIPNICEYFGIRCIKLDEFMIDQNWKF